MTLGEILNEVYLRAGRNIVSVEPEIIGWVNENQKTFCKEYPYWFLTKEPHPIAAIPSVAGFIVSGGSSGGYWLLTTAGQGIYPLSTVIPDLRVTQLKWVKQFSSDNGEFIRDIPVTPTQESIRNTGMLQGALAITNNMVGEPCNVTLIDFTAGGETSDESSDALIFSPVPNDAYIYSICLSVDNLEPLADLTDANFLTINYPYLLVWMTLKDVGLYIGEDNLVLLAETKSADIIKRIQKEDKKKQIRTLCLYPKSVPPPYGNKNNRFMTDGYV
jgi:hypothetical protein